MLIRIVCDKDEIKRMDEIQDCLNLAMNELFKRGLFGVIKIEG